MPDGLSYPPGHGRPGERNPIDFATRTRAVLYWTPAYDPPYEKDRCVMVLHMIPKHNPLGPRGSLLFMHLDVLSEI